MIVENVLPGDYAEMLDVWDNNSLSFMAAKTEAKYSSATMKKVL